METKLANENFHVQSDLVEKLKELEKNNVKLELAIDNLKEEKAELLQNIVEAERQFLLWERKIQLEKEIQAALDPNIGQSELKVLHKDIHRMELRLEEIRRKQEQTIHEMERQVYKRETIQLKYIKGEEDDNPKGVKGIIRDSMIKSKFFKAVRLKSQGKLKFSEILWHKPQKIIKNMTRN